MFRKKQQTDPTVTRKRLQRLSMSEVYDWSEVLTINIGRGLSLWRRGGGHAAIDEVEKQLDALKEVCAELRAREAARA